MKNKTKRENQNWIRKVLVPLMAIALAAVMTFSMTACGGDDPKTPTPTPTPTTSARASSDYNWEVEGDTYSLTIYESNAKSIIKSGDYVLIITTLSGDTLRSEGTATASGDNISFAPSAGFGTPFVLVITGSGGDTKVSGNLADTQFKNVDTDSVVIINTFVANVYITNATTIVQDSSGKITGGSAKELVNAGVLALIKGNINTAINYFNQAYTLDPAYDDAILYSTLGELAGIAVSKQIGDLLSTHFGIRNYPGTIDSLINFNEWMLEYPDERLVHWYYDDAYGYGVSWYDINDSWDKKEFFERYGITTGTGYYRWTYALASETQISSISGGYIDSYSENNTYYSWYDSNNQWFFNEYDLEPRSGYYEYVSENINGVWTSKPVWRSDVKKTSTTGTISSYYDGKGVYHTYVSNSSSFFFEQYGLTPVSGYYKYTYILVSSTPIYEDYGTVLMPEFDKYTWLTGSTVYNNSLTSKKVASAQSASLLMVGNLIGKNTSGFNTLLDNAMSAAFGTAFDAAYARGMTLNGTVQVDGRILQEFGLNEFFGEILGDDTVFITKAELQVLFSLLRVVKGSLEWIASYDWNTNLNIFANKDVWSYNYAGLANPGANIPFKNNFLKARAGSSNMAKSKASFILAIDDAAAAYDYWISGASWLPSGYKAELTGEYNWIKTGLSQLKTAINNGSTLYFDFDEDGFGTSVSKPSGEDFFGINFGNFFTSGYFAIDKLFQVNAQGLPVFYGVNWNNSEREWEVITGKAQIANFGSVGLKVNKAVVNGLIIFGKEIVSDEDFDTPMNFLPSDLGEVVYGWYYNN
ncbi:MAG: hypothetical protein FWC06_07145 [Treponema sp.]|nr:hypothetical protein [Treponema sp.]